MRGDTTCCPPHLRPLKSLTSCAAPGTPGNGSGNRRQFAGGRPRLPWSGSVRPYARAQGFRVRLKAARQENELRTKEINQDGKSGSIENQRESKPDRVAAGERRAVDRGRGARTDRTPRLFLLGSSRLSGRFTRGGLV